MYSRVLEYESYCIILDYISLLFNFNRFVITSTDTVADIPGYLSSPSAISTRASTEGGSMSAPPGVSPAFTYGGIDLQKLSPFALVRAPHRPAQYAPNSHALLRLIPEP